jgi:hypothetical protein
MTARKRARKSVTTLNREFECAYAAYAAIPSSKEKRWECALARCDAVAQWIVDARAETIDEMLIKSRAIVWLADCIKIENIATWRPSKLFQGHLGVASLGKDLSRIAKRLNVKAA